MHRHITSSQFSVLPCEQDLTAASAFGAHEPVSFVGRDLFFTELWTSPLSLLDGTHTWASDGGIAAYEPVLYEVSALTGHAHTF